MENKIEVRFTKVRMHSPILVKPITRSHLYTFRSVFGYVKDTCDFIEKRRKTSGLRGCVIVCDIIFLDVDEDDNFETVRQILIDEGIQCEVYSSGGRGGHFHIQLSDRLIGGFDVIYTIKSWVQETFGKGIVDVSMIHESGQIRLEGAVHGKTGKVKQKIQTISGSKLTLELLDTPDEKMAPAEIDIGNINIDTYDLKPLFEYVKMLSIRKNEGERTPFLFTMVKIGQNANLSLEEIVKDAVKWNNQRCRPPHYESYIVNKVREIWKQK